MDIIKYIAILIYIVLCFAIIVLTFLQSKQSSGASGTIVGSSTNNFYEKNKTKTHEGKMKKWTIILGVAFAVLAIALGIVYVAA